MERSNATRTATPTPNRKEGWDLLGAQQHDSRATESLHATQHPVAGLQTTFGNRAVQHSMVGKVTNQTSAQRSLLRQIPIHTLQQNLGNRALARLFQQTLPAPAVPELSRKCACGDETKEERTEAGKNSLILQRSPVSENGPQKGAQSLPAGAPAAFQDDFDPVLNDKATAPSQSAKPAAVQTSIQRAADPLVSVQRQPAPAASGATPLVAQRLSWGDFRVVPNRIGGMSAQTGIRRTWRNNGTGFKVAFNPALSWSVQADQTAALLRHEQYHLNLAVLMANKANAASGTMGASALIKAFNTASTTHDHSYDHDTENSQNTNLQTQWEQDIDAGVPEFPITPSAGE